MQSETVPGSKSDLRDEALRSLRKKRDFRAHLLAYVLVNALLWAIWGMVWISSGAWFPWPLFALFGWGIGVVFHAWDVYARPITEEEIRREEARLQRR